MSLISFDNINSWQDFKSYAESLPNKKKTGDAFEHLTYLYFKLDPKYSFYDEVYKMSDVPTSDLEKLNIPRQDLGIDLIAKVGDDYHPIQCKYHTEKKRSITFSEVSTFLTQLESNTNFKMGYIASTADNTSKNYDKLNTKEVQKLLNNTWYKLDESFFNRVREFEKGREYSPEPFYPREHQKTAVENAYKHFIKENNSRGKLIFPCGAGKSLTGYWMMEKLASKSTIVAVPSLSLIKQTLDVYLKEVVARNKSVKWLCICSDEGIGKNDDILYKTNEVGVPCTTDEGYIKSWLKRNQKEEIIIFTTYQSGRIIADISKSLGFTFDLGIYDEAHKTVGKNEGFFSYLLFEKNISIKNRIFMTATERFYRGVKDDVLTMDDPEDYGEVFSHMSFKEAIEKELLTDYKVITIEVKKEEVAEFIKENNLVKLNAKWGKESEARSLASMIALRKAMKALPIKNAVSFHSSIERAVRNKEVQDYITKTYKYQPIETFTVSGKSPTSKREVVINEFATSNKPLITNSRCLTEGVDVPNIDCIVFADPRKSKVDIVQALGRALRKKKGKEWGYVILPIIYDHSTQEIDNDNFQEILNIVRGLAANDERIIEEFKDKSNNKGKIIGAREEIFSIDPVLLEESELANNLSIRLWENLSRFNWMAFEEAREYVRGLNLLNATEWKIYSSSKRRPHNLPSTPNKAYLKSGWVNWGDFLGTGNIATKYFEFLSYEEARNYARNLNLKSVNEWYDLKETRPSNIPSVPKKIYENSGWTGWGDFLGIADYKPNDVDWLSFKKARSFVRKLGLKNKAEWDEIKKTDKIPYNIPKSPDQVYENWKSVGDWIGTDRIADQYKSYLDFEDARKFMSENNIKSLSQWRKYRKENIIENIPHKLERTYKNKWKGAPHFFGTEILSYKEAKEFIQKKGLKSSRDYFAYIKNTKIEVNLPLAPHRKYKKEGWVNWKDFLGYSEIKRLSIKEYSDIERARKILRPLNLLSSKMYFDYLKNNPEFKLKHKLSTHPNRIYKNKGWKGFQDYLGYSNDARKKDFVDYDECKSYAIKMKVKTAKEWNLKRKSRPKNIPSDPPKIYKNSGWKGWADFLGKEKT